MDVSDILAFLSIAIAILSISYASDRKIWLYKFSKWDSCLCALWFLTVNYFIFFDSFYANGWYLPQLMESGRDLYQAENMGLFDNHSYSSLLYP